MDCTNPHLGDWPETWLPRAAVLEFLVRSDPLLSIELLMAGLEAFAEIGRQNVTAMQNGILNHFGGNKILS